MANEQFAGFKRKKPSEVGNALNWLGYGDSDAGKTTALGTLLDVEQFCPVLHLDVEKGADSLGSREDDENLSILQPKLWADLQKIYDKLFDDCRNGKSEFRSVTIDNGTYAQSLGIYKLLGVDANYNFDNPNLAEFKDFNGSTEQVKRLIRAFADLPLNFFMTAHADMDVDPKTKQNKMWPMFTGKLKRQVPGLFSHVHYFYKQEVKDKPTVRNVLTESTPTVTAKTRKIDLPQVVPNFSFELLANAPLKSDTKDGK